VVVPKILTLHDWLGFEESPEYKPSLVLFRSFTPSLHDQERAAHNQPTPESTALPFLLFFPRKLSPPSAADDPFLG
jgi:hypothetical protein